MFGLLFRYLLSWLGCCLYWVDGFGTLICLCLLVGVLLFCIWTDFTFWQFGGDVYLLLPCGLMGWLWLFVSGWL